MTLPRQQDAYRLIGLLAFLLFASLLFGCNEQQPQNAAAPAAAMPPPEVGVVTVSPQSVTLTTELPGRTSPFLISEIRPQVNGLIQKRLFVEGADVEAGQVLYQIDPAPFEAAYENAEANLSAVKKSADRAQAGLEAAMAGVAQAEASYKLAMTNGERFTKAYEQQAVSASERDQAVTQVEVARATLEAAKAQVDSERKALASAKASIKQAEAALKTTRIQLDYTQITAPISGRIGRSAVTEGAIVTAYQPTALSTIQQTDPVFVDVPQSTLDVLRLSKLAKSGEIETDGEGQAEVGLMLEDGTEYPHKGTLEFRDVTVDPTTGSVTLRMVFPNPDQTLLPGMFVRAVVQEGVAKDAILAPQDGVRRNPKGLPLAYVVNKDNVVEQRLLTLDRAIGDKWLVTSGLQDGDRVVVEGSQKIRPGATVRVADMAKTGAGAGAPKAQPEA
ncbi:efflux transporter, RND family, MFP subunit [Desulfatibacillum aliphaticivorans]|uniref:Efflux transporter, RND family, MFP subunit n=1 Tax=Desulfatibacillum aliphaticivorans TaxID=218208 RepID=B8FD81_DESAL|nr:efflux RND transporter periplasmic adaptor subunit [Desulfatibacillum aliphaticivorans]ACL06512.1 efflux transporter, RND family, MFP subunit [Desulfatibacillum aliphaticivorans]